MIVRPALATPVIVFTSESPEAVAENTINKRSPGFNATEIAEDKPLLMLPIASAPVRGGARFSTAVVGLKTLLPAGARYTCAVIVTVDPISVSAIVFLKDADIAVIVPP